MDQCACAVGGLIHIDFKDNSNPVVEKIDNDFSQYGYSLCIVDVHASHADLTPDYAAIPSEMKEVAAYFGKKFLREVSEEGFIKEISNIRHSIGDRAVARALHYFEEDKRVEKITKALKIMILKHSKHVLNLLETALSNIYKTFILIMILIIKLSQLR